MFHQDHATDARLPTSVACFRLFIRAEDIGAVSEQILPSVCGVLRLRTMTQINNGVTVQVEEEEVIILSSLKSRGSGGTSRRKYTSGRGGAKLQ